MLQNLSAYEDVTHKLDQVFLLVEILWQADSRTCQAEQNEGVPRLQVMSISKSEKTL